MDWIDGIAVAGLSVMDCLFGWTGSMGSLSVDCLLLSVRMDSINGIAVVGSSVDCSFDCRQVVAVLVVVAQGTIKLNCCS